MTADSSNSSTSSTISNTASISPVAANGARVLPTMVLAVHEGATTLAPGSTVTWTNGLLGVGASGSTVQAGGDMTNITVSGRTGDLANTIPRLMPIVSVVTGGHYSTWNTTSTWKDVLGISHSSVTAHSSWITDSAAGTVVGATAVNWGTMIAADDGAVISNATAQAYGLVEASAGGASVIDAQASGVSARILAVGDDAIVSGATASAGGVVQAWGAGALVTGATALSGGDVGAEEANAVVSDATALTGGTVTADAAGATAITVTVSSGGAAVAAAAGAILADTTAFSSGYAAAMTAGAVVSYATALDGASVDALNGGTVIAGTAASGGVVLAGGAAAVGLNGSGMGVLHDVHVLNGGLAIVGGANLTTTKGGRTVTLNGAGLSSDGVVDAGGVMAVASGGTQVGGTFGGTAIVQSGGSLMNALFSGNDGHGQMVPGALAANNTVEAGATLSIAGGVGSHNIAQAGGTIAIGAGTPVFLSGSGPYGLVTSGVASNGVATGDLVGAGGSEIVGAGGTSIDVNVSGGQETVLSGGSLGGVAVIASGGGANGTLMMSSGAQAQTVSVGAGGVGNFDAGALASVISIGPGGVGSLAQGAFANTVFVGPSGTLAGAGVSSGMTVVVSSGGVADQVLIGANNDSFSGTNILGSVAQAYVSSGGVLSGATLAAGQGSGAVPTAMGGLLKVEKGAVLSDLTVGKYGQIEITDINSAAGESVTFSGTTLSLTSGGVTVWSAGLKGDYDPNSFQIWNDHGKAVVVYDACFLAGTMIRTPSGEKPVETLREGDEIMALVDGRTVARKITALHGALGKPDASLPLDLAGWAVCVKAGAFGDGLPARDLRVTGEHCFWFDGRFVPVRLLVNGSSIRYDTSLAEYAYYHLATDPHSVIWAEGVLTESWLDTAPKRTPVEGEADVVRVDFVAPRAWHADAAGPLETDQRVVQPLWAAFAERAKTLGMRDEKDGAETDRQTADLTEDPDLRLRLVNGVELRPERRTGNKYVFRLPAHARGGVLVSRTFQPSATVGAWLDDRRVLGVLVGAMTLVTAENAFTLTDHLETEALPGWDVQENSPCRWTNGQALLPYFGDPNRMWGGGVLAVEILAGGPYALPAVSSVPAGRKSGVGAS